MIDRYLRVVRTMIDAFGDVGLAEAMERARVPLELRDQVRARYEEETALPIRRATVLSGSGGPRPWFKGWDPSTGYYWLRQRQYLIDKQEWNEADVDSLDDATDRILEHLEDPRPGGPAQFDVRGLVMGYVQSGKTANFCALAAKAADAGYKLVIVLSGIHNSLRLQTQRRLDKALGLDPLGVREPEAGRRWIGLTRPTLRGDFRAGSIDANVLQGNEHVVLVCKKNASVLRRLTEWMANRAPASLPVLIIDDEADQASVNTGGNRSPVTEESDLVADDIDNPDAAQEELDPSTINGLIRTLVRSFGRVSYVAYTATPFANVLINHLAIDREVFEDLYPKDFIVTLPPPNRYTGAERLFGREALPGEQAGRPGLNVIDFVPDTEAELLTPTQREVAGYVPVIPDSLRDAFLDFVLATASLSQRLSDHEPATMLVHTHHRTEVQNRLGEALRALAAEIRQAWRYDKARLRPQLVERWNRRFRPVISSVDIGRDTTFDAIEEKVDGFFKEPLPVIVLNSGTTDELDYERDPSLRAVVVGGNRLSRGLTLEGLLVSYYVRETDYYDALMQMGRWFGYREKYVDLTRIFTTRELAGRFRDLALAEEELRQEIARYKRENLTPLDFGPRIRSHPVMMITAKNKMGGGRVVYQSYSGYMLQTTSFRLDDKTWLLGNLEAARAFMETLGWPRDPSSKPQEPIWSGVSWQLIDGFLTQYKFDERGPHEMAAIRQYIREQVRQDELVEWRVAVPARATYSEVLGVEPVLSPAGRPLNRIARTRLRSKPYDIGSLVNPAALGGRPRSGDEEIGLTDEQLLAARANVDEAGSFPKALRRQRSPREGLILLYPVSPFSRPSGGPEEGDRENLFDDPAKDGVTVVGLAMVFPTSASAATIEYVVGSVGPREREAE